VKIVGEIKPEFKDLPMVMGKEITLSMPTGEKRKAQFAVVSLANITPSHNYKTFSDSQGYPKTPSGHNINDRNYTDDKSAQAAVQNYAQNLEPERLITTSRTESGTPIITNDGFVVSGNNRTMSIKLAADQFPGKYEDYKKFLYEEASAYGLDPTSMNHIMMNEEFVDRRYSGETFRDNVYAKIEDPVLVRIDYDFPEYTTLEMAKYNKNTKKSERPLDKVIKLSSILEESPKCSEVISRIVGQYETASDFYSVAKDQKELSKSLVQCNILTSQEMAAYYDGVTFTNYGKDFLENLLAAMILSKDGLIASNTEGVKQFRNTIITSLPVLIKNDSLETGSLKEDLNAAVILESKVKASGLSFNDYITQSGMFEEKFTLKSAYLNRLLKLGRNKFKNAIEKYNENVVQNQQSSGLFADTPTTEQAFKFYVIDPIDENTKSAILRSAKIDKPIVSQEDKTTEKSDKDLDKVKNAIDDYNKITRSDYWLQIKDSPKHINALENINELLGFDEKREWMGRPSEDIDEANYEIIEFSPIKSGHAATNKIKLMQTPADYWFFGFSTNIGTSGSARPVNTYGPFKTREDALYNGITHFIENVKRQQSGQNDTAQTYAKKIIKEAKDLMPKSLKSAEKEKARARIRIKIKLLELAS